MASLGLYQLIALSWLCKEFHDKSLINPCQLLHYFPMAFDDACNLDITLQSGILWKGFTEQIMALHSFIGDMEQVR